MLRTTCACLLGLSGAAFGQFVEDVQVLHTLTGDMPGDNLGFVGEVLDDVDGDDVNDIVLGVVGSDVGASGAGRARRLLRADRPNRLDLRRVDSGRVDGRVGRRRGGHRRRRRDRCDRRRAGRAPSERRRYPDAPSSTPAPTGDEIWTADGAFNGDKFGIDVDGPAGRRQW